MPPPAAGHGHSVITPSDRQHPRKLSEEFALIVKEFEVETVTLREVFGLLHGRGYVLLMMMLALPFCTPIPLPTLSTPLGLIIALISGRLALGTKPWLPARLLDTRLPPHIFAKVFELTRKIVVGFERMLRPRLLWVTASPRLEQLHALPIVFCATILLLPLPIPLSNVIPAWAIILMAGGLLERDGWFILGGYLVTLLTVVFFGAIAIFGKGAVEWLWAWMK
ncbi:MAG: exopolysaccharide biosynthesis protein [Verrucomicrobia bacterium]|nr:exopolysaccharide biosynthesis protein [Verrucomicrobiota bacterium]